MTEDGGAILIAGGALRPGDELTIEYRRADPTSEPSGDGLRLRGDDAPYEGRGTRGVAVRDGTGIREELLLDYGFFEG